MGDTDPKLLQVRTTTIQLIALLTLTSVHEPLGTAPIYNDCKGAR